MCSAGGVSGDFSVRNRTFAAILILGCHFEFFSHDIFFIIFEIAVSSVRLSPISQPL
jgi:hypothetical protein